MSQIVHDTVSQVLSDAWLQQLQKILACESAVLAGDDVEALHRFRVALRTTRALLRLFRRYLPESEALAIELAWLSDALNRARDLDIVAGFIQRLNCGIAVGEQNMFAALLRELATQRAEQTRNLQKLLHGRRYRRLLKDWRHFIEIRLSEEDAPIVSRIRFGTAWRVVALEQILVVLRDLRCLDEPAAPAELHRLRIRCKRLRYLLDANAEVDGKKKVAAVLTKRLIRLQDILGQSQDLAVIRAWLAQVEQSKGRVVSVPPACHLMVEQQRHEALAALPAAWQSFVKSVADI